MKLENDFLVDAPLDETWATLLDIQRVARCLPGATLESDGGDGIYRGSMQVRLGPMTLAYKGTARMAEVEEDAHNATIEVRAKELKGQGTASARIRNRLEPGAGGATHVTVETDLSITGRPAQFGRGIMEDVAGNMLGEFAKRLEKEVLEATAPSSGASEPAAGESSSAPAPGATSSEAPGEGFVALARSEHRPAPPPSAPQEPAVLDLGGAIAGPVAKRAAMGAGVVALGALLFSILRRRKRGLSVRVDWR
jgi:carbon monoxide dehydrogenase subunit G